MILPSSMVDFVPCARLLQNAYCSSTVAVQVTVFLKDRRPAVSHFLENRAFLFCFLPHEFSRKGETASSLSKGLLFETEIWPNLPEITITVKSNAFLFVCFCFPLLLFFFSVQDLVVWYGTNYAGTQITQRDFQNKGTRTSPARLFFVLEVPPRYLRPSIIYSVPCDRIMQRAYY